MSSRCRVCVFQVLPLLLVLAVTCCTCLSARQHCREPAQRELEEKWREERPLHETFFQLPIFRPSQLKLQDIERCQPGYSQGVMRAPVGYQDRQCPYNYRHQHSIADYFARSNGTVTMCPSYPVINFDPRRIPAMLQEVACQCQHCAMHVPHRDRGDSSLETTYSCQPVTYYTRVLRRTQKCHRGVYVYRTVWEPLTLACACGKNKRVVSKPPRQRHSLFSGNPNPNSGRAHSVNPSSTPKPASPPKQQPSPPLANTDCSYWS